MDAAAWRKLGAEHEVGGHRLFVVDSEKPPEGKSTSQGRTKPTLVLLHGFPTSSADWIKIWGPLTERYRCIAPDFLGLGFSAKPRRHRYSILEQADLVEELLGTLSVGNHHVLAHDYGDTVAQELLARDIERDPMERRIRTMAFLNGGLFPETHRARPIQKLLTTPLGPVLARLFARGSFDRSFRRVFGKHTQPSRAELDAYWEILETHKGRHVLGSLLGYMAERRSHRERWVQALIQSSCPLLVINGSDDPVSGAHMVARYRDVVGHGTVVELSGIGHYPHVEAPRSVLRAYLGWREDLTRARRSDDDPWDLLIAGALMFDGSGGPPFVQDVAVRDGRIAARGVALDHGRATEVVDGRRHWLLPGLLDIHTHFDLEVELAPTLPEAVRHGTTTVVMSNCSLGLAFGNQRRGDVDPIVDCFARVENVPKGVLREVASRAVWTSSQGYLDHLDGLPLGPNVVPMIPYSMLRVEAMGLDSSVSRPATALEIERMEDLLEAGMRQGYAGFSTDALPFHYLANPPRQRSRIPAQHGALKEISTLLDVVRRHDRVWQATPPKDEPLMVARLFAHTSGRLYGEPLRTTAVAALDVESNKSLVVMGKVLSFVLNRLLKGWFRLQALAAPFKTWAEGAITPLAEEIEPLRELNEPELEDREARQQIMEDPAWQQRFLDMWREGKRGLTLARLRRWLRRETYAIRRDLADMVVEHSPVPRWRGETLQQIYERLVRFQGGDPVVVRSAEERAEFERAPRPIGDDAQFLLHLLRTYDRELVWWTISANADPRGVAKRLWDPLVLPGFSDAGAHLVNMAFFDANLRALKIAQAEDDIENRVAHMVHRLTQEPANFFGIDAGTIEVGDRADLVLIDPVALAAWDPEATVERIHRHVLSAEQLVNRPPGVVAGTWVAGVRLFDGEQPASDVAQGSAGTLLRPRNHWPSPSP